MKISSKIKNMQKLFNENKICKNLLWKFSAKSKFCEFFFKNSNVCEWFLKGRNFFNKRFSKKIQFCKFFQNFVNICLKSKFLENCVKINFLKLCKNQNFVDFFIKSYFFIKESKFVYKSIKIL